jgi:hypothetical protein
MMLNVLHRYRFFSLAVLVFILCTTYYLRDDIATASSPILENINDQIHPPPPPETQEEKRKKLKYKPPQPPTSYPIVDNFPLAAAASSSSDLPPIPEWNRPPSPHVPESTPLFIGFTRNWRILQQVVVSYITAGWPPSDIYVIENTGVMDSNKHGRLSLQNPFFLNHTRLHMLGVNVIITPTLLTFAQLQNFYLWTSIQHDWDHYFWSHMDVVTVSFEDQYADRHAEAQTKILPPSDPKHDYSDFKSVYKMCVEALRNTTSPDPVTGKVRRWGQYFFSYDHLALVNVAAFIEIGGWDTLIPFYMTDCDMHARLAMAEFEIPESFPGMIFDVGSSMDDIIVLYRQKGTVAASFRDPNFIEDELKQIAEGEKQAEDAGLVRRSNVEMTREASREFASGNPSTSSSSSKIPKKWADDEIHSQAFEDMVKVLDTMYHSKWANARGRNTWQARQTGGQGDPFYRDSAGFDIGIQMTIEHGRAVFREKWGHRDCDIVDMGLMPDDAWKMEHDWKR